MSWPQAGTTSSSNPPLPKGSSRLKQVKLDPLEAIGLPSKGDERLLDFHIQEEYYNKIIVRYKALQNANSENDATRLDKALESLSIHDPPTSSTSSSHTPPTPNPPSSSSSSSSSSSPSTKYPIITAEPTLTAAALKPADSRELATLTAAMRKLREAIVASARVDRFALAVYIFIIRATVLVGGVEGYLPALLHFLRRIVPVAAGGGDGGGGDGSSSVVISTTQLDYGDYSRVFLGYYILDLACRQGDLGRAYQVRYARGGYRDGNIDGLLRAMVRGDWCLYWRHRERMDRYQERLCQWGDEKMAAHALNCLGASYLSVAKEYVERVTRRKCLTSEGLGELKPGWELEGSLIVIKRIKKK